MIATRIIPCLDIKDSSVAKGVKFQHLTSVGAPVELAARYAQDGADEITFLDVTATIQNRKTILSIVRQVAARIFIPLTVGGGIRSREDAAELFLAGAEKVALNTAIVARPTLITEVADAFGSQSVVASIDAARTPRGGWQVFVQAGRTATGIDALQWAREVEDRGAGEILLTSIDCDGTQAGYDLALTAAVADAVRIPVIASGGGGTIRSMVEAVKIGKADAILLASVLHYGTMSIRQIKQELSLSGIAVRRQESE